jgi:hypothetical protein
LRRLDEAVEASTGRFVVVDDEAVEGVIRRRVDWVKDEDAARGLRREEVDGVDERGVAACLRATAEPVDAMEGFAGRLEGLTERAARV